MQPFLVMPNLSGKIQEFGKTDRSEPLKLQPMFDRCRSDFHRKGEVWATTALCAAEQPCLGEREFGVPCEVQGIRGPPDVAVIGEVRNCTSMRGRLGVASPFRHDDKGRRPAGCRRWRKAVHQRKAPRAGCRRSLGKSELAFVQYDVGITCGCFLHEGM